MEAWNGRFYRQAWAPEGLARIELPFALREHGPWIVGGAVLRVLYNAPFGEEVDVDVWCASAAQFLALCNTVRDARRWHRDEAGRRSSADEGQRFVQPGHHPIDLHWQREPCDYDITASSAAWDGKHLIMPWDAVADIAHGVLRGRHGRVAPARWERYSQILGLVPHRLGANELPAEFGRAEALQDLGIETETPF